MKGGEVGTIREAELLDVRGERKLGEVMRGK